MRGQSGRPMATRSIGYAPRSRSTGRRARREPDRRPVVPTGHADRGTVEHAACRDGGRNGVQTVVTPHPEAWLAHAGSLEERDSAAIPSAARFGRTGPAASVRNTACGYVSTTFGRSCRASNRVNPTAIHAGNGPATGVTHGTHRRRRRPRSISAHRAGRNLALREASLACGAVLGAAGASMAVAETVAASARTPSRSSARRTRASTIRPPASRTTQCSRSAPTSIPRARVGAGAASIMRRSSRCVRTGSRTVTRREPWTRSQPR